MCAQLERTVLAMAPLTQRIMITLLKAATGWLRESPRYLCEVNDWLVKTGEGLALAVVDENSGDAIEQWFLSGKGVASFCALVRG